MIINDIIAAGCVVIVLCAIARRIVGLHTKGRKLDQASIGIGFGLAASLAIIIKLLETYA